MIFRQLFDKTSCTFTYLIADADSKEAILIDPVDTEIDDYIKLLKELGLKLIYSFETHVHADHVTASGLLRQAMGSKTGVGLHCGAETADCQLQGGETFTLGHNTVIKTLNTPGHTPGSISFLYNDKIFTGDALFIGGCGRTDFQNGDAGELYDSVTQKIFTLPGETLVYPGHDYNGCYVSCVYQEKTSNPRLAGKTRNEFIDIMDNLNLPMPKLLDKAVPANLYCGVDEEQALQMASASEYQSPEKERRGLQGRINRAKQKLKLIDCSTAKALIRADKVIILDVREQNEFDLGHIDKAIHLPGGKVKSEVKTVLGSEDKNLQILIYCATGNRSALAGHNMQELGYTNIASLIGGYVKWKREKKIFEDFE